MKRAFEDTEQMDYGSLQRGSRDTGSQKPAPLSEYGKAIKILQTSLRDRSKRRDQLMERMRRGKYRVDSKGVALKILEDLMADLMARIGTVIPFMKKPGKERPKIEG